ncbi:hypothetical protein EB810_11185 [Altererythrobacter sp. FM1]|nr:hypothetical protein EB810_11185 [Altererythrobacter sp. FM1]
MKARNREVTVKKFGWIGCVMVVVAGLSGCGDARGSYPDVDRQLQLLSEFQQVKRGCSDGLTSQTGRSGEFDGAEASVCVGRISSEEPYGITLITGGSAQARPGTVVFEMSKHSHPLAYEELYEYMFKMGGIESDEEQQKFRTAMRGALLANQYVDTARGRPQIIYTNDSGMEATMTEMGRNEVNLRFNPPQ